MARPRKPINAEEVSKLAAINCSVEEIADWFGVNRSTIQRRFAAVLKEGRSKGKCSLKRRMWETAMNNNAGSVTMQIWLSKQMLGYTDKVDQNIEAETKGEVIYKTQWGNQKNDQDSSTLQPSSGAIERPSIEQKK